MARITGTNDGDTLSGTADADLIKGFGGDDVLKGSGGADILDGGAGVDTAVYFDSPGQVVVDLAAGSGQFGYAEGDRLVSIDNVHGSAHFDWLYGNDDANTLVGLDGDDRLFGRGGADILDGGYGRDVLTGGSGGDVLNGGEGEDTAAYRNSPAGVSVLLISDFASGGDADGDSLNGIENLDGSEFADFLWGNNGANDLDGFGGNDSLRGFGGSDNLSGGEGHDALYGMDGADLLSGGEGNDRLEGGTGADLMEGGGGADRFVWASIDDTGTTTETGDYISAFNPAEADRLHLYDIDADVYAAGNQAFTFIGAAAFSGTPGEINYVHVNGETIIQMQTGTSADVEGIIRIYGIVTPEASWFAL
jgi:Ca2+-binding RTX toxin-like protein